jgi:hypothetical protein
MVPGKLADLVILDKNRLKMDPIAIKDIEVMKYFSVNLYTKMLHCAVEEGISREDFTYLSAPIKALGHLQVVSAHEFLSLREILANKLGRGFAVRVGQKMKIEDCGVLGLS